MSDASTGGKAKAFAEFRQKMNDRILAEDNRVIKRMFSLDNLTYREEGELDTKTKELMGLVASLVLRCDDCVSYHISQSLSVGAQRKEIMETMSIGLVVGGSIVIPHLRRAVAFLDELEGVET
ncbi:MAG: carboxymuconolactone decarboxylase family protein [Gammaproteobacteria bacterium]|nr:carboxymuconolactone decarboxylase family protein [Gammaproteobacteria bacterium]